MDSIPLTRYPGFGSGSSVGVPDKYRALKWGTGRRSRCGGQYAQKPAGHRRPGRQECPEPGQIRRDQPPGRPRERESILVQIERQQKQRQQGRQRQNRHRRGRRGRGAAGEPVAGSAAVSAGPVGPVLGLSAELLRPRHRRLAGRLEPDVRRGRRHLGAAAQCGPLPLERHPVPLAQYLATVFLPGW